MSEEYDPTANWTIDEWRRVAKRAEDAAATNALAWIRLRDASDLLIAEVRRLRAEADRGHWADANAKRSSERLSKRAEARALDAQGLTVAQIMSRVGRSRRTVEGYISDPD